jgi:hypothetical protein
VSPEHDGPHLADRYREYIDRWDPPATRQRLQQRTVDQLARVAHNCCIVGVDADLDATSMIGLEVLAARAEMKSRELGDLLNVKVETWGPIVRRAIANHAVAESNGRLKLLLEYSATGYMGAQLAQLSSLHPVLRGIDCALVRNAEDAHVLLQRLEVEPFAECTVLLIEPHRTFSPAENPVRLIEIAEYAVAVSRADPVMALIDHRSDLGSHEGYVVEQVLTQARDGMEFLHTLETGTHEEILAWAGGMKAHPFIARPKEPSRHARQAGEFDSLKRRGREIGEVLLAAAKGNFDRFPGVLDWCKPREAGALAPLVLLENLAHATEPGLSRSRYRSEAL